MTTQVRLIWIASFAVMHYAFKLPESVREHANFIDEKLKTILICDPAVGSGAFVVGMMNEIVRIRNTLTTYLGDDGERTSYHFKRQAIQNCLYGVDIEPSAVEIAKLRLWLSLVVDEEERETIQPLPNLDYKIVQGNSLLSVEKNLLNNHLFVKLEKLKPLYFDETSASKKDNYKNQIDDLISKITNGRTEFDFEVYFSEIFHQNKGFDVVIGNPPYVQLYGTLSQLYKDAGFTTFVSKGDIYQLFYEKGCQLLKLYRGLLCYITSDSWMNTDYGKSTRRYFADQHTLLQLLVIGEGTFENAVVNTSILITRHGKSDAMGKAVNMNHILDRSLPPAANLWVQLRPQSEDPWRVLSVIEQRIMDKMEAAGVSLRMWNVKISRGITTGYNNAFIIDNVTKETLIATDPKSAAIIRPMLHGRNIQRYRAKWDDWWLIIAKFGSYRTLPKEFPAIYEHLMQYEERLKARGQCRYSRFGKNNSEVDYVGQHHWLELDNNPKDEYLEMFSKEKLMWADLTQKGRFAYDDSEMFCINTATMMTGQSLKYLCALLNSNLIAWFMKNTAPTGMGMLPRWKKNTVEAIPIPKIPAAKQLPFIRLIDSILMVKVADPLADTGKLEAEIDQLVYALYGLTKKEIAAVESRI